MDKLIKAVAPCENDPLEKFARQKRDQHALLADANWTPLRGGPRTYLSYTHLIKLHQTPRQSHPASRHQIARLFDLSSCRGHHPRNGTSLVEPGRPNEDGRPLASRDLHPPHNPRPLRLRTRPQRTELLRLARRETRRSNSASPEVTTPPSSIRRKLSVEKVEPHRQPDSEHRKHTTFQNHLRREFFNASYEILYDMPRFGFAIRR